MKICAILNYGSNVVFSNQEALKQQNFSKCEKFLGVSLFVICSVFSLSGYFVREYFKHKKIKLIQTKKLEQQPTAEKADKAFKEFNKKEAQVEKPLQVQKNLPEIQVKQNPEIPLEKVQVIEKDKQVPKEKAEVQQDPPLALEKKQESPAPKIVAREDFLGIIIIKIVHGERAGNQVALNSNSFIQKEIDIGDRVKFTPQKFEEIKARIGLNNPDEEFEVVSASFYPIIKNNVEREEEQKQQKEEIKAIEPENKVDINPPENLGVQVPKEIRAIDLENEGYKEILYNFGHMSGSDKKILDEEREKEIKRRYENLMGLQNLQKVNAPDEVPAEEKKLYIRMPDGSLEVHLGTNFIDAKVKIGERVKFKNAYLEDRNPDAEYEVIDIQKKEFLQPVLKIKLPNEKTDKFNLDHFNIRQVNIGQKVKLNSKSFEMHKHSLKALDANVKADDEFEVVDIGEIDQGDKAELDRPKKHGNVD